MVLYSMFFIIARGLLVYIVFEKSFPAALLVDFNMSYYDQLVKEKTSFLTNSEDWEVVIPKTIESDGIILFLIEMRIGSVKWTVQHRYREFSDLNKVLVSNHSVSKDILPPKVFFNKKCPKIVESRKDGLQSYLNTVLRFLSNAMPFELVTFLDMDKYDMWFLFHGLANSIRENNWTDAPPKGFQINIVAVNALSQRLKLPCPPTGIIGCQHDFCTVLEFFTNINDLTIIGGNKEFYGTSNIQFTNLPFELSSFRSLTNLRFSYVSMANFIKADDVRSQVEMVQANNCNLQTIADLLLCDNIHKDWKNATSNKVWHKLKSVDLAANCISVIDSGLELMPNVTDLNLSFNTIETLQHICKIQHLTALKMSHNKISVIDGNNIHLPSLKFLDLSNNVITDIHGISHFSALETLNISFNLIDSFDQINHIGALPNILNVDLNGNPISQRTDYRVKVLEKFGKRISLLCLDNEQSTTHELELIALIQALKFVQEGRSLSYNKNLTLDI